MRKLCRSTALLTTLSAAALSWIPVGGVLAGAPGPGFALLPAAKPDWSDPAGAGAIGVANPTGAFARPKATPNWGTPEPAEVEPAPKPGTWSATVDPVEGNAEPRTPGTDTNKIADLMYGLGLQQLTVRLTRHF